MSQGYEEQLTAYRSFIEAYLDQNSFRYDREPQAQLFEAMRYSLLAGGKRLRPVLVMDFCRMCGGNWRAAAPFGAAVEMVHTYSLIHDDLPCMDNDDYRRGRLTNHKVYGEAMALLAGDALLTSAFGFLSRGTFSAEARIQAVDILSKCAGEMGMVGGQALDIQSEQRQCTKQEVLDIQSRKSGALIRAACQLGVVAGGGGESKLRAAGKFADHLGLAFQIRDDMLDVIGNAGVLGKATGVDKDKNTFVRLYGLDRCRELVQLHTGRAIAALAEFEAREFMTMLAIGLTQRES